ncbi:MAG: helicase-related protein [Coriobacteriales bacterium]|nr:helicase-related protein [Coriobacteriales bacterium]
MLTKEEAHRLAALFNMRGYRSVALDGSSSDSQREDAIERLECDRSKRDDWIELIFTVDIFNEGVDIPSVNLVIMLRPTESAIIFVQQLGRGLRKHEGKDYVLVLDFIGNYKKSYLIPIALCLQRAYCLQKSDYTSRLTSREEMGNLLYAQIFFGLA